jgi:hypothetical protein
MEELQKADREAYDLLQSANPHAVQPPNAAGERRFKVEINPPLPPMPPGARAEPREEDSKPDAADREQRWRQWERGFYRGPLRNPNAAEGREQAPPSRTRFEVAADGAITVHTRDGDTEMSKTFKSAEELRGKAPRLYKRYQEMESRFSE